MERKDLLKILYGDVTHINHVNENDMAVYDMEVVVLPQDVRAMLCSYLEGKISSDDLTNWAGFICVRGEYVSPNYLDDEMANYYEDMFYVVQKLSTPEIDGQINKELVNKYLVELDKYFKK